MMQSRMRRTGAVLMALVLLAGALAACGRSKKQTPVAEVVTEALKEKELIVSGYGGEYETMIQEKIIKPFEHQFGVKVVYDINGTAAEKYAKIASAKGGAGFDVAITTAVEAYQGMKEDLLMPITEEQVPNLKHVYPELREHVGTHGVSHEVQVMGLVYNPKHVQEPVDSWQVLWDAKYKGRVLLPEPGHLMGAYMLLTAAALDGGGMNDMEPGFKRMEALRPQVRAVVKSSADAVEPYQKQEVWLMPYWDARSQYYIERGESMKMVIPKEGSVAFVNTLVVPKGTNNAELAMSFINFWLEKELQKAWALGNGVGPSRPDVGLPEEHAQYHITNQDRLKQMILPDLDLLRRHREEWAQRVEQILAP